MKAKYRPFRSNEIRLSSTGLACLLGAALTACADPEARDLGFTQSAEDLTVDVPDEPFWGPASEFLGRWTGSAEDTLALTSDGLPTTYQFPSGSTQIVIEIEAEARGFGLVGRLSFGAGEPLPPPTERDAGYPPGVDYPRLLGYTTAERGTFSTDTDLPPFEGFAYAISDHGGIHDDEGNLTVADGVATFFYSMNEPLDPWCRLQTSYPSRNNLSRYGCVPDLSYGSQLPTNGETECSIFGPPPSDAICDGPLPTPPECTGPVVAQVNCDQLLLCTYDFCLCDETRCTENYAFSHRLSLRRVGDELVGVFDGTHFKNARGLNVPLGEVRLHLEP